MFEGQGGTQEEVRGYVGRGQARWGLVWDCRDDHTDMGFYSMRVGGQCRGLCRGGDLRF